MISLLRSKKQRVFNESDVIKAKVLVPHITNALHNAIVFSSIENEIQVLRASNELLPSGVILLDSEIRPMTFNSEAKRICSLISRNYPSPSDGTRSEGLSLPSIIIHDCLTLKNQIASWNHIDPLQHQRILSTDQNQTFKLDIFIIWQPEEVSSGPYFLVSLENLSGVHEVNQDILQQKHHLTCREMEIIRKVVNGQTNNEIAEGLFVSKLTIETHLSNIFEKIGVRNRTQLANLIKYT